MILIPSPFLNTTPIIHICPSLSLSLWKLSFLAFAFSMEDQFNKKRVRDESAESDHNWPEAKRLREDLLGFLDDSDPDPTTQDLDSVLRSFEEELSASSSPSQVPVVVDLTSDSGESRPDLGYLLEASDDELGLPPSATSTSGGANPEETELVRVSSDSSGIGEFWGFEDQVPSYDSFPSGIGDGYNGDNEYVAFDGLFEYSDAYFDSADFSWRYESLPAPQ